MIAFKKNSEYNLVCTMQMNLQIKFTNEIILIIIYIMINTNASTKQCIFEIHYCKLGYEIDGGMANFRLE